MALLNEFESPHLFERADGYELITQPSELRWPDDDSPLPDKTALKLIAQDKALATSWIQAQGWVLQWQREERLYLFKVPTKFWDGTNVPRSSLGMPLVYEQVESVLPQFMSSLFGDDPPFKTMPRPGTSMEAARANDSLLAWEMKQANVKQETRLGLKYMLIHGTGIWKWGWHTEHRKRTIYKRAQPYKFLPVPGGGTVKVAQKGTEEIQKIDVVEEINHPFFEHRNIRYVLVDPALRSSDIRQARFVIDLKYPSITDLDRIRDYEGYNIPPREELIKLLFTPEEVPTQNPLEVPSLNLFQEFNAKPRNEKSTLDKMQQPLELAEYWTKDRVFTVLQGKLIIRNEKNPHGVIPFFSQALSDVLGNFYGIGFANLIGNEQRIQQGVINGYFDDFSLTINGMFTRVRGSNVLAQQLRMRPGGVIDQDNPDGVGILPRQPLLTNDVMAILSASDARSARRTAASETGVQGALPSQNSSITSTATGVNSLSSGTGTRLQYVLENFADQVFVPMLEAFHEMNAMFLTDVQIDRILTQELQQAYEGDTLDIINGQYDFSMLAAGKLQARAVMKQNLPLLYQFLLTEPVMTNLQQNGQKIDIGELTKMLFDVSGWPNYQNVIVPMSQQDIQQAQANSPAAIAQAQQQAQAQQTQLQTQSKAELQAQQNDATTSQEVIKELLRNNKKEALGLK